MKNFSKIIILIVFIPSFLYLVFYFDLINIDHIKNQISAYFKVINLTSYYEFLDTLTLLEECAFINILALIGILFLISDIYFVFFANEIIKYFKLEEKYPKLHIFFKLRYKFQIYNLLMNLFWLVGLIIFMIVVDLVPLAIKFNLL